MVSTYGRLFDFLCDHLWGCEDFSGNFYPGVLHDKLTQDECMGLAKDLRDSLYSTGFMGSGV